MLQGVLSRIRVESEECDELRAQVAKEQAPSDIGEMIPPMYHSAVEKESWDESMLMVPLLVLRMTWMWVGIMVFGSVVAMPLSRIRGW